MTGLMLLTDEEQRSLSARPQHPPRPSSFSAAAAQAQARPPRMLPTTTHFPNSAHRRSSLPSSDHSTHPRTDFTGRGKPSAATASTFTSSSNTSYVRSELTGYASQVNRVGDVRGDRRSPIHDDSSYPILRDDAASFSSTGSHDEDHATANRYAGTSSGLHISVTWTMVGVATGVALGLLLGQLHVSSDVARWVSLPGDLFLRALKCLVIPYVFCAVAVAIGDIVFVGKVSIVGAQTFRMFALFWVSSTVIGMTIALLFRPLFRLGSVPTASATHTIGFSCSNDAWLAVAENGSVACTNSGLTAELANESSFIVTDIQATFSKTSSVTGITQLSLTDQLIAIIEPLISENITSTLANGDVLSTITFAMVLGAIAGRNYFLKTRRVNYLYLTLLQLRNTFFLAMEWVIWLSPLAVVSIIAGAFATNESALRQFTRLYTYVLAGLAAAALQMLVVFPMIVFVLTRCNPYHHMSKMLRAYMFAFACSSSLATAPITLTCVKKAKVCSQSLGNFVISIGVCSNLSAVGWYVPIAIVFIAESSGHGDQITVLRLVGIFVLSVLQCAGTAPIPSGVLVSIATIYTTIFGVASAPDTFAYVAAMDFIIDRLVTVCDVNDDIMCLKVIAENTDETVIQEQLGEREE